MSNTTGGRLARCMVCNCPERATKRAQLHIYPRRGALPIVGMTPIVVCGKHADDEHGRRLLTDNAAGWECLSAALFPLELDRERSRVKWVDLIVPEGFYRGSN
ncbi:MAG: hypothetical protein OEZ10_08775 [Gammaproteobacteria bacterium]|nr:hypothetical protein [Gammaproteobacteria bacterium]